MHATQALQQLQAGYQRYRQSLESGSIISPMSLANVDEHRPIAAIVSCSDARVVPEYLFGQSPGQLFVVRVAGNIVDTYGLASLEFAVEVLNVPIIIVLGHRGCGAIQAAVDALLLNNAVPGDYLARLIECLKPIVNTAQTQSNNHQEVCDQAVFHNVQRTVSTIQNAQPLIAKHVINETVQVVGAIYCTQTGNVQFVETA